MRGKVTFEIAKAAYDAGAKTSARLAVALGVSGRQATRWLTRIDPEGAAERNASRPCSPEVYARMDVLAREGVPPSWIAEDVGQERSVVDKYRERNGFPRDDEYKKVYSSIRWNPTLMALHREFAPQT